MSEDKLTIADVVDCSAKTLHIPTDNKLDFSKTYLRDLAAVKLLRKMVRNSKKFDAYQQ